MWARKVTTRSATADLDAARNFKGGWESEGASTRVAEPGGDCEARARRVGGGGERAGAYGAPGSARLFAQLVREGLGEDIRD
jgi:hypothetical protein